MPVFPLTSQLNLFQQPPGRLLFKSHWSGHMLILYPQGSLGKQVSGCFLEEEQTQGMETSPNKERMLKRAQGQSAPVGTSPGGRGQGLNMPVI